MHTMGTAKTMRNVTMIIITFFPLSPTACVFLGSSVFCEPKETVEELEIA